MVQLRMVKNGIQTMPRKKIFFVEIRNKKIRTKPEKKARGESELIDVINMRPKVPRKND